MGSSRARSLLQRDLSASLNCTCHLLIDVIPLWRSLWKIGSALLPGKASACFKAELQKHKPFHLNIFPKSLSDIKPLCALLIYSIVAGFDHTDVLKENLSVPVNLVFQISQDAWQSLFHATGTPKRSKTRGLIIPHLLNAANVLMPIWRIGKSPNCGRVTLESYLYWGTDL